VLVKKKANVLVVVVTNVVRNTDVVVAKANVVTNVERNTDVVVEKANVVTVVDVVVTRNVVTNVANSANV